MPASIENRTMRKVYLRILPFTFCLYLICYLDRANIGFASLTMNRDLGLSSYVYGLGAGAFFWGYFLLEVPSNLILERVGARRWISRIMISWGIVSGAFAFVQGPTSFFALRFLLGVAEAGFFPGMILYFTYWFPPFHRGRIIAGFDRHRCADFDGAPATQRRSWPGRLAVAVPGRGASRGCLWHYRVVLPDGQAIDCKMAGAE
jgi:ACS family tartrate transporter-like MFS transporter